MTQPTTENASGAPSAKRRSQKTEASCAYKIVLAVLACDDDLRADVLADFRHRGGSADTWPLVATRSAMADALCAVEDRLEAESRGRMTATRVALRTVRRRVECEVGS